MEKKQCEICGKWIEGYEKNIDYLMKQHMLKHDYDKIKEEGDA